MVLPGAVLKVPTEDHPVMLVRDPGDRSVGQRGCPYLGRVRSGNVLVLLLMCRMLFVVSGCCFPVSWMVE